MNVRLKQSIWFFPLLIKREKLFLSKQKVQILRDLLFHYFPYVISLKWDSVRDAFHRVDCIFGYQELASFQGESPIACLRCKTISRDLHLKRSLLKILPCALPPKGWKTAWSNRLSLWTLTMRAQSSSGFGHWLNLIWSFQPKLIQDDSLHSEVSFLPYCIKKCILPLYGFTIC